MMIQPAPSPTASRGYDVRLCLIRCNKLRGSDRKACFRMCFQEYWNSIFSDITQVATENGISPPDLIEALKDEFDVQFIATTRNKLSQAAGS